MSQSPGCERLPVTMLLLILFLGTSSAAAAPQQKNSTAHSAEKVSFARDIRPILSHHCGSCHGMDEMTREAGLRLDVRADATQVRKNGKAAIVPGKPEQSVVIARIQATDEAEVMPPPETKKPLSERQKQLLRDWIAHGADYADHWAFVPPKRVEPPETKRKNWGRNGIDQFILARLEQEGLTPSLEAPRETLLRRVTLDLTGLPPTIAELDAFLADQTPQAYERVVDRLLDSPRYAERMAMHWLDVARYADTNGYNNDEERSMWPWRDWVIDAFARNLPYDQFVIEQLAGDLLPGATLPQRVATGFNRNHVLTTEGGIVEEEYRVEYVADRVHTTATVFMGMSFQCARCHDHKFDPFTQRDYYRLFAYFNNLPDKAVGYNRKEGYAPPFVKVPSPTQQTQLDSFAKRIAELEQKQREQTAQAAALAAAWETSLSNDDRAQLAKRQPVFRLALDESAGEFAIDSLEPARRGTVRGKPAWTAGKLNGALEFDGATHVEFGPLAAIDLEKPFSFSVWVYPTSKEPACVISKMDDAAAFRGFDLILEGGKVAAHLAERWPDSAIKVVTREPIKLNEWQHVVVSHDGSRHAAGLKISVNGKLAPVEVAADQLTGSIRTDQPLRIGQRSNSASFRGKIDDVQGFVVELSGDEAAQLAAGQALPPLSELLARAPSDRTDAQRSELQKYFLDRVDPVSRRLRDESADLVRRRAELERGIPGVMVMEELPEPRTTHMLRRGQYDQPGEAVPPGVPGTFPSLPPDAPSNRLGLARWLVDPAHPLTARVAVNRWWELFFGAGLVETAEDFGVTGTLPTHPELLDWLAVEFAEGGGQGAGASDQRSLPRASSRTPQDLPWDIKRLVKLIVMSATYRQASTMTAAHRERDPKNQLLSRGPRFRLPAETVRDSALALGGLLVDRIGGPSVKPYQPEGLWEDVSVERREKYVPDPGDGLYRRTMYTFWKRTCPPPAMSTFDAPTRETCTIRRARTNTPLQALVLLNDPTYIEAARKMAERIISVETDKTFSTRLRHAFRVALSRTPLPVEQTTLATLYEQALERFRSQGDHARQILEVGRSPYNREVPPAELAAWTIVCTTILNLDETISKE